jgi:hypothetical protein
MAMLVQHNPSTLQAVVGLWQSKTALPIDDDTVARVTQNVHDLESDAVAIEQLPTLAQWLAALYLRYGGQYARAAAWYVRIAPVIDTLLEEDGGVADDWELMDYFAWATTNKSFVDLAAEGPHGVEVMLETRQRVWAERAREEAERARTSFPPTPAVGGACPVGTAAGAAGAGSASVGHPWKRRRWRAGM